MSESWGLLFRVTTLQTLQISVTIRGLLSGTCSMPVLLVSISVIRIWTSTCIHYATNDKINMYISSYVQFLYEMLMFRLCSPQQHQNEKKTVTWKCLVQLSAYQFPVLVTSVHPVSVFSVDPDWKWELCVSCFLWCSALHRPGLSSLFPVLPCMQHLLPFSIT